MRTAFCFLACVVAGASAAAESSRYLAVEAPDAPAIFAPPILSDQQALLTHVAFAPGLRHVVLSAMDVQPSGKVATSLHESRRRGGEWSPVSRVESLDAAGFSSGEAAFSPDGRWLYFSSNRPPSPGEAQPRVFRSQVRQGRVGPPELVPLSIPHDAGAYYPRILTSGDLSFTSRGANGRDDLFVARRRGRGFGTVEPMQGDFNSPQDDWDLVETRDGRLRLWVSARAGGRGRTDLYYSRRSASGEWSGARHLAAASTAALETAPALTPDDRMLFFLRRIEGQERMFWVRLDAVLERR